ncbi:MAG: hypothetical protein IKB61_04405, partial [Elusimicrobiaceae bacterium]|nr:hypothetical protein [Elusimicrobiaceae bacterium]
KPQPEQAQALPQVQAQAAAAQAQQEKRFDRKKWLMLLALVFFLFSIIFIVPVNSLPGLRNLVWWMGFSAQDTQSMSFGHALLAWAGEGTHRLSSKYRSDKEISLFDREKALAFNPDGPQSALFDAGAVNADRRKRGLGPEGLYGAYNGQDNRRAALNRKVNDLSQEARQNEAEKNTKEVFFGADADLMARAAQQGNVARLKGGKLFKGDVAGSVAPDWFAASLEKAARLSNSELDKAFGASTMSAPLSNLNANITAKDKPKRDLAQIWLMSKASNRAKQLMLKKQLAAAGYVGMEMPKKVYDSLGENSGVMMSGEEMMKDLNEVQMQLLNEEQCRDLGAQANSNLLAKMDESISLVKTITSTVPRTCDADVTGWTESLTQVRENCSTVKDTIKVMSDNCGAVKLSKEGSCSTERLDTYATNLTTTCGALATATEEFNVALGAYEKAEAEYQKAKAEYDAAVAAAAEGETVDDSKVKAAEEKRDKAEDKKDEAEQNKNKAQSDVNNVKDGLKDSDVYDTFNINEGNSGQAGGGGDFFPEFGDEADL